MNNDEKERIIEELKLKALLVPCGIADSLWEEALALVGELQTENAALRERLGNAVELPMIYEHITYPFFEETYSETVFYVVYKENERIITINCGKNREAAEASLAELRGEKDAE